MRLKKHLTTVVCCRMPNAVRVHMNNEPLPVEIDHGLLSTVGAIATAMVLGKHPAEWRCRALNSPGSRASRRSDAGFPDEAPLCHQPRNLCK